MHISRLVKKERERESTGHNWQYLCINKEILLLLPFRAEVVGSKQPQFFPNRAFAKMDKIRTIPVLSSHNCSVLHAVALNTHCTTKPSGHVFQNCHNIEHSSRFCFSKPMQNTSKQTNFMQERKLGISEHSCLLVNPTQGPMQEWLLEGQKH